VDQRELGRDRNGGHWQASFFEREREGGVKTVLVCSQCHGR
jgi:hypothetical protein